MLRRLTSCLILGALLLGVGGVAAQDSEIEVDKSLVVQRWTVEEGLPGNTVTALHKSRDGYIWLATSNGIARFDGLRFTAFTTANTPALPNNRFAAIYEAEAGDLWFLSEQSHLVRFSDGQFSVPGGLPGGRVSTTYKEAHTGRFHEHQGRLWVGTDAGLSEIVDGTLHPVLPAEITGPVWVVSGDADGVLWLGTYVGDVLRYDPRNGSVGRFSESDGLPRARIHDIHIDSDGTPLAGTRDGVFLLQLDGSFNALTNEGRPWIANTRSIFVDAGGRLHFAVAGGEYDFWLVGSGWFIMEGDSITRFPARARVELPHDTRVHVSPRGRNWRFVGPDLYRDDTRVFSIPSRILSLGIDPEGNVWVGTEAHGLFQLRPATFQVVTDDDGLPSRRVESVFEDRDGNVWVGTDLGLATVHSGRVEPFDILHAYRGLAPTYFPRKGYSRIRSPGVVVWGLYQDPRGRMWVGTNYEHCRIVGERCLLQDLGDIPQDLYENGAALLEDSKGRFWIGTKWGLILGENGSSGDSWTRFTMDTGLTNNWIRGILETSAGELYFGTAGGGLMRFDGGQFEPLTTAQGLSSDHVLTLIEDRHGTIWIGTEDRGLCRLDADTRALGCLSVQEGLFDNSIYSIVEDDFDRLWMGTGRGIFWVSLPDLNGLLDGERSFISSIGYTEHDGLRNRQANGGVQPSAIKAADGRLWFATLDGVAVVDPSTVNPTEESFQVVLETAAIGGEVVSVGDEIVLPAGTRTLDLSYTALHFARPENVHFRYRLEGFDPDWREVTTTRSATYTNLGPGTYRFRVGAGIGGQWQNSEASITVRKLPLFWQTGWFVALMMGLAGLGVYGFIRLRLRRLEARNVELERVVAERTEQIEEQKTELIRASEMKSRFLANISHEFRTPLTLALGPLRDLEQGRHGVLPDSAFTEVERAGRNAGRLLNLINQLLDLSTLEAGALILRPRKEDLVPFLRQVTALFESAARRQSIQLEFTTDAERLDLVFDREKLEKVIVNLLGNALKFTPAGGKIHVSLAHDGAAGAAITVMDTGRGIPPEHLPHLFDRFYQVDDSRTRRREGNGIGLALAKELIELHEGSIVVSSEVGRGTSFVIHLPGAAHAVDGDSQAETSAPVVSVSDGSMDLPSLAVSGDKVAAADVIEDEPLVLIVEDNADMRAYIRSHLAGLFSMAEAENGAEGLRRAKELVPDLVISDVMMPEMDGFQLGRALRQEESTSHVPLILLTANATDAGKMRGLDTGADAYLVKPFDAEELRLRVRKLIERRRELQKKYSDRVLVLGAKELDLPAQEVVFLERVHTIIEKDLGDGGFGVDRLADEAGMSRRQLLRKVSALTGETPGALIRRIRLERAAQLLDLGAGSVKEVAHQTGFTSVPYFSRVFGETHGMSPSAYADRETTS